MADTTPVVGTAQLIMRNDTEANWIAANPVLGRAEFGIVLEEVTGNPTAMKIGDGVTPWGTLPYFEGSQPPALGADTIPIGMEMFFSGTTPPEGWLVEDGQLLSRSDYPDLWAHAQASGMMVSDSAWTANIPNRSKFSSGDGTSTFRLPNLITSGLFIRAQDPTDGDFGRRQEDDLKAHTHGYGATHDTAYGLAATGIEGVRPSPNNAQYSTTSTGGTETRPKNAGRLPIIKALSVSADIQSFDVSALVNQVNALQAALAAVPLQKSFVSTDQTMSSGGLLTIPHGLGTVPTLTQLYLKCIAPQGGWAVGDVQLWGNNGGADAYSASQPSSPAVWADATNVYVRIPAYSVLAGVNKSTGVYTEVAYTDWRLIVRAWA